MTIKIEQDSTYSWLIAVSGFVALCIESGLRPCLGVYFLDIVRELNASQADGTVVFAVANSLAFLAGPVVSVVIVVCGLRFALMLGGFLAALGYGLCSCAPSVAYIIAHCVLIGLGSGLVRNSVITAQAEYFTARYRNLAMAAVMGAGLPPGVGTFIFPPLLTMTSVEYGWRGSMLLNAGLLLQCLVVGALLMKTNDDSGTWKEDFAQAWDKLHDMCTQNYYWLDAAFVFQGIGLALAAGCGYIYYSMIIPVMVGHNMSPMSAAVSLAIQGGAALGGRILGTALVHWEGDRVPLIYVLSLLVGMSTQAISVLCTGPMTHGIVNFLVGISNGVFFVAMAPFMVHAYGPQRLAHAIGWLGLYNGVGGLVIPRIAGEFADRLGTDHAFSVAAASGLGAIIASSLSAFKVVKNDKRKRRRKLVAQAIIDALPHSSMGGFRPDQNQLGDEITKQKLLPHGSKIEDQLIVHEKSMPENKISDTSTDSRMQTPSIIVEALYEFEAFPQGNDERAKSGSMIKEVGNGSLSIESHSKLINNDGKGSNQTTSSLQPTQITWQRAKRSPLRSQRSNPVIPKAQLIVDESRERAATAILPVQHQHDGKNSPSARFEV